jgi:glucose-6-phosphate 1-dehydrogenase
MPDGAPAVLANPLRGQTRGERIPEPCNMVIFGASGDLTHRKLLPALYNLELGHLLPPEFCVIGFARRPKSHQEFRDEMKAAINAFSRQKPVRDDVWADFEQRMFYVQSTFEDQAGYQTLLDLMRKNDQEHGTRGNRLYYLSTPPSEHGAIVQQLHELEHPRTNGQKTGWSRIIVEKPFGHDLKSAQELNELLHSVFEEDQVYRIDHYLGKETVQNILVFRFANGIFEPIWNRDHVDHVQITVAEAVGVEGRAGYYEQAGTIRDMVANHMLQLLALTAMEPPSAFDATSVRDEKVKVLRAIHPWQHREEGRDFTVRGQYGPGWVAGQQMPGYREEPGVNPESTTDTYVALKLYLDNWRWAGVPFYLRTGKALPKRVTEIAVTFKNAPFSMFRQTAATSLEPNVLAMRIQPDEGIVLKFGAKVPGPDIAIRSVNMDFLYGASFDVAVADAYERLLLDCLLGDSTLFTREDEVQAQWTLIDNIVENWQHQPPPKFPNYAAGTWGPEEANRFIERDGRSWRKL